MRKTQTTTIDTDIWKNFKIACVRNDLKMNDVLEAFMKGYVDGTIVINVPKKEEQK